MKIIRFINFASHKLKMAQTPTLRLCHWLRDDLPVAGRRVFGNLRSLSTFCRTVSCDTFCICNVFIPLDWSWSWSSSWATCAQISLTIYWARYQRHIYISNLFTFCGNKLSWCQIVLKCLDRFLPFFHFFFFLQNNLIRAHDLSQGGRRAKIFIAGRLLPRQQLLE